MMGQCETVHWKWAQPDSSQLRSPSLTEDFPYSQLGECLKNHQLVELAFPRRGEKQYYLMSPAELHFFSISHLHRGSEV